jgi:two-component system NarL family response regulator
VVRQGLTAIIDGEPDMMVVASAADGRDAVDQYVRHQPDVVLMDLQLPQMSGFEAIRQIRKKDAQARIIVLTMYRGDEDVYRAIDAGAAAYLLKDTLADNLVHVIREVHAGRDMLPTPGADTLANRNTTTGLTPREQEVLQLIAKGMRNKEIADHLGIKEVTVHAHMKSIFGRLHVHDRTAALTIAIRRGIVHLD